MNRLVAAPVVFAILLGGCVTPQPIPEMSGSQSRVEPTIVTLANSAAEAKVVQTLSLESTKIYGEGLDVPTSIRATITPTFVILSRSGWALEDTFAGTKRALAILAQCGIYAKRIEVMIVDAPDVLNSFSNSRAKALLAKIQVSRPAVFFVHSNLELKKHEFEVVARANSKTRPELRNTIWIVRNARDVGEGLARMFMFMFLDRYEVSNDPNSLFFSDHTSYENSNINADQCSRAVQAGNEAGLAK